MSFEVSAGSGDFYIPFFCMCEYSIGVSIAPVDVACHVAPYIIAGITWFRKRLCMAELPTPLKLRPLWAANELRTRASPIAITHQMTTMPKI
jgi:hypothetical protein